MLVILEDIGHPHQKHYPYDVILMFLVSPPVPDICQTFFHKSFEGDLLPDILLFQLSLFSSPVLNEKIY